MTEITLSRLHGKTLQAARAAAEGMARKMQARYHVEYLWDGNTLRFKRAGAAGELALDETEARLRIQLAALLTPLRPLIELQIKKFFDENFSV